MSNNYDQERDGFLFAVDAQWLIAAESPVQELSSSSPIPEAIQIFDGKRYYRVFGFKPNPHPRRTPQDLADADREQAESAKRLFVWQHFATEEIFNAAAESQGWRCIQCSADLHTQAITHFNAGDGGVYCRACTPLKHRYGSPS